MKLTTEQWATVEKSLAYPHGRVELMCDGRKVVAEVQQAKALKFVVVVFVDGFWRGEWMRADKPCDEQKFYQPHEKALHSAADLKMYRKVAGAKQYREAAAKTYRWFSPHFSTGKAFRRRISSTCQDISLVDCTELQLELLAMKRKTLQDEIDSICRKEPA